ncbi:ras-related protein rab-5c [Anaeramoeba flamelloides]|uniref:Ras-related protein rab-5c n=1 Tax=Anaeramoeba flamelloides TaxID=1746091 RepID=A0AAV7YFQ8_9EUKA|nr:ras-related protein rab-5c [Anaeramoeba flamelloides]KAJ6228625.1 ras-related protein rab-5c [Anaeramoeba flamelloides]
MTYINSSSSSDEEENDQIVIKIVMLGQCGTGKTSIVIRFVKDEFIENTKTTVGANFFLRSMNFDEKTFCVRLWDTSGQERFDSLTPLYYRNANIAILVYDVKNITSLEKVKYWVKEIKNNVKVMPLLVIVGNKMDEYNEELDYDTLEKAKLISKKIGATVAQTSAKTGEGINQLFEDITKKLILERSSQFFNSIELNNYTNSSSQQPDLDTKVKLEEDEEERGLCCW